MDTFQIYIKMSFNLVESQGLREEFFHQHCLLPGLYHITDLVSIDVKDVAAIDFIAEEKSNFAGRHIVNTRKLYGKCE